MQAPRAGAFWVDSRLPLTASRSYRPMSLNGPRAGPWLLIRTPLALIRSLGRAGTPWQPGNAGLPATMRHQRTHHDGKPGFVPLDADGTHTLPDFLGNIAVNSRASLLFIDVESGDLLCLAETAEIDWDGAELLAMRRVDAALPLGWRAAKRSPVPVDTGESTGAGR